MKVITQHAAIRMQQRGINNQTLENLFRYGEKVHSNKGKVIVFFNKQSRKRLKYDKNTNFEKDLGTQMDAYAVVSMKGEVITVGHRFKRIIRQ